MIWLFIMNVADMKYDKRRIVVAFSVISCMMMFFSLMTRMINNFEASSNKQTIAVREYLEEFPVTDKSITTSTLFAAPLYKQKELYVISTSKNPDEKSAPSADIVLLDKKMKEYSATYMYYVRKGMKQVPVDSAVSGRVCRLEKTE